MALASAGRTLTWVTNLSPESIGGGKLRCRHCRDVIGVYEPLVIWTDGGAHTTSLASEPTLAWGGDERCYHAACYELRLGSAPAR